MKKYDKYIEIIAKNNKNRKKMTNMVKVFKNMKIMRKISKDANLRHTLKKFLIWQVYFIYKKKSNFENVSKYGKI